MSLKEDFISRLVKARSSLGWSQADLAKASGISATQLSRYEGGLSEPRPQALGKLAKSLNVQFDWLAHGRGPIEGDSHDRPGPPGMRLIELDFSDTEITTLKEYAQAKGVTLEMAARQLLIAGMESHRAGWTPDEDTIRHLERTVRQNAKLIEDLVVRVAKVEKGK